MTKKIQLKITGMHCTSCAMNIDGELEDTEGVKESNTNYAKAITEVQFDEKKIALDKMLEVIKKLGYTATPASQDAESLV